MGIMANQQIPGVINFAPEPGSVEIREVEVPQAGEGEVILKVVGVGVCGSDLHQWQGQQSWPVQYPVILGHEFCGDIVEVGSRVSSWREGDRVVSETAAVIDPNNPMSRQGLYNLDPTRKGFGYGVDGAMTKFIRVPERCLHRVPEGLKPEIAALTEPCSVAFNAVVRNGSIEPGDRILVLGPGPIGLLSAAMARLCGAEVAVQGLPSDESRLKIAEHYGCSVYTDTPKDWALERDGLGVDGAIDAAGVSATLKTALELVRPGGWISKVGWGKQPPDFSLDPMVQKNIRLQGSFSHYWPIWERVLQLLASGALEVEPVLGGIWPLEDWHTAFETMHSGKIAKAVLTP